jgi:hypothetical protein
MGMAHELLHRGEVGASIEEISGKGTLGDHA